MAKLDDLEFRITANVGELTTALNRGSAQVGQFAAQTATSFDRVNRQVGKTISSVRSLFGLFGVGIGVNALRSWITGAVRAAEAAGDQSEQVKRASEAMAQLKASSDRLAISLSSSLVPAMEAVSAVLTGWSRMAFGSDPFPFEQQINATENEIAILTAQLASSGGMSQEWRDKFSASIDTVKAKLAELKRQQEQALGVGAGGLLPSPGKLEEFDLGAIRGQRSEVNRSMSEALRRASAESIGKGQELSPELDAFISNLQRGEAVTRSMTTEVEEQVEAWREAKDLFEGGFISGDSLTRVEDSLLTPITVTVQRLKDVKKEAVATSRELSQAFGGALQSTLADAFMGIETDFRGLIKRMAAELFASGIVKALGTTLGGGGGFFGSLFAGLGARAHGGPVSAGSGYVVGENGPEVFMPRVSGRIMAGGQMGGGVTVNQYNTISGGGGDMAKLPAILAANNRQLKAELLDMKSRGRF